MRSSPRCCRSPTGPVWSVPSGGCSPSPTHHDELVPRGCFTSHFAGTVAPARMTVRLVASTADTTPIGPRSSYVRSALVRSTPTPDDSRRAEGHRRHPGRYHDRVVRLLRLCSGRGAGTGPVVLRPAG